MSSPFWFFSNMPENHVLSRQGDLRINLSSADLYLQKNPGALIDVVYPLPWDLDAFEGPNGNADLISKWFDFYLEALSFFHNNPGSVYLWPLDVFLKSKGVDTLAEVDNFPFANIDAQRVSSYLLEVENPELFDLLESLEAYGQLEGRDPYLRSHQPPLDPQLLDSLRALTALALSSSDQGPGVASPTPSAEVDQNSQSNIQNNGESESLLHQLHQVQEELERYYLEAKVLKEESAAYIRALNEARELLAKAESITIEGARQ